MSNCGKFGEAFGKAFNEAIKTEAGQAVANDLAMFCWCNGKTSKKAIKEAKGDFMTACFYTLLKENEELKKIFAECVRMDLKDMKAA